MSGHGEKLTRKQEQAIAALLTTPTLKTAAAKAGIGEETLRRWMRHPGFTQAYLDARQTVLEQATAQLSQATGEAVLTLREVMGDVETASSARVTAARAVLEYAYKAQEQDQIIHRITLLEELITRRLAE